jgi:hypothetical protein
VFSAGLDLPFSERAELALQAHEFAPEETTDTIKGMAIAAQVWMSQFGGSPKEQLAAMLQAQPISRTEDIDKFAKNIAPGVQGFSAATGATQRESFAFMSALGKRMEDSTGRVTRNAALVFGDQLKEMTAPFIGADASFTEMLEFVRGESREGKKIRSRMLGVFEEQFGREDTLREQARFAVDDTVKSELLGRAKAQVFLREFMQAEGIENIGKGFFKTAFEGFMGPTPETVTLVERKVERLMNDPAAATLTLHRAQERTKGQLKADRDAGVSGVTRRDIIEIATDAQTSQVDAWLRQNFEYFLTGPRPEPTSQVRSQIRQLESIRKSIIRPSVFPVGGRTADILTTSPFTTGKVLTNKLERLLFGQVPEADRERAEKIDKLIEDNNRLLERLLEERDGVQRVEVINQPDQPPTEPVPPRADGLSGPLPPGAFGGTF